MELKHFNGAHHAESNGQGFAGKVFMFDSLTKALGGTIRHPICKGMASMSGDRLLGDINEDGRTDFIVGAPQEDPDADQANYGKAYIYLGPHPRISVEPEVMEFGEVEMSSGQNDPIGVTLTNEGAQDLVIPCPGVYLAGPDAGDFVIEGLDWHCVTGPEASIIPPGGAESFSIRFQPNSIGVKDATLAVESNDPFAGGGDSFPNRSFQNRWW
jgi:hypothetical protein